MNWWGSERWKRKKKLMKCWFKNSNVDLMIWVCFWSISTLFLLSLSNHNYKSCSFKWHIKVLKFHTTWSRKLKFLDFYGRLEKKTEKKKSTVHLSMAALHTYHRATKIDRKRAFKSIIASHAWLECNIRSYLATKPHKIRCAIEIVKLRKLNKLIQFKVSPRVNCT